MLKNNMNKCMIYRAHNHPHEGACCQRLRHGQNTKDIRRDNCAMSIGVRSNARVTGVCLVQFCRIR